METLNRLEREQGQAKPKASATWRKFLRRPWLIRTVFGLVLILMKILKIGADLYRALRE